MSCRTDLFVEVNNLTKGNTVWAHFSSRGYYPTSIHLSRPIPKENVRIETHCCIFKRMIVVMIWKRSCGYQIFIIFVKNGIYISGTGAQFSLMVYSKLHWF